jgi:hypothetical protein
MPTTYNSPPAKIRDEFSNETKSREGYIVATVVGLMAALIIALFIWSLTQLQSNSPPVKPEVSAGNEPTPRLLD